MFRLERLISVAPPTTVAMKEFAVYLKAAQQQDRTRQAVEQAEPSFEEDVS